MAFKHGAEVLCNASKHKKDMMCLMEKIHVLDRLHSGMSYSTIDHEFNV